MGRVLLFLLLGSSLAFADLTFWRPHQQSAIYVLPGKLKPQSYLQIVRNNKDLASFVNSMNPHSLDEVRTVKRSEFQNGDRALLIANSPEDHNPTHPRVDDFGRHFNETYVLPIGSAYSLTSTERTEFYRELSQYFGLLVAMGGDDVDPQLYKEKVTWAYEFNRTRDTLEASLIHYMYHHSNIKIFGVCRGMQLTSVVLGGKLIQDNVKDLKTTEQHRDGAFHKVIPVHTKNNLFAAFMKTAGFTEVNSYHHQSANEISLDRNKHLEVSAKSPEGIVEAAESYNKRVFLIQSHPEKPDTDPQVSQRFFSELKSWAGFSKAKTCLQIVK